MLCMELGIASTPSPPRPTPPHYHICRPAAVQFVVQDALPASSYVVPTQQLVLTT